MTARKTPPGLPATSRRRRAAGRRKRTLLIVGIALGLLMLGGVAAGGLGAFAASRASCDLAALRPVPLGRSSPVLAADGSLPGVLPAERDRQPVTGGTVPAEIWSGFVRPALAGSAWRALPPATPPARHPWHGRLMAAAKG